MAFIDEANLKVCSGKGGDGLATFRRERCLAYGGPDGGDGGKGGNVYIVAQSHLNTLLSFQYQTHFLAESGARGGKRQCRGRDGKDCWIAVPVGTIVYDADTRERLADLVRPEQYVLVAKGGARGLGNVRFKSATNRAPRHCTPGGAAEQRTLHLELRLLAEVGVLGFPNVGKSTLVRTLSAARPKVASYPFTTLCPQLGVVSLSPERRFVIADMPGLVEGAAEGKGLGHRFLRHINRTFLLLHFVDLTEASIETSVSEVRVLEKELQYFQEASLQKPRWLVFNKKDAVPEDLVEVRVQEILKRLEWQAPSFVISAHSQEGVRALCEAIMGYLEEQRKHPPSEGDAMPQQAL